MQKITPHLWFDNQAEEAAQFYISLFPDSKIGTVTYYDKASALVSGQAEGSILTLEFELAGQQFAGLNGGPQFQFNPSISFHLKCATKNEVDELWNKLSDGGDILMPLAEYPFSERYGWCNDRYGVSWQVIFTGDIEIQQKITPVLMFVGDVCGNAEEAVNFYASVFDDANATIAARYGKGEAPDQEGTVRYAHFTLEGQEFGAMDSAQAHDFAFNEAISFLVDCKDQQEVDYFWNKLIADSGEESMCGWLKDRYGVSWQIVPQQLTAMLNAENKEKALQATKAMLQMKKIDIAALQKAFNGG
jgi:predicted 3-demethylubiquinone-9 3-methyltransferase (glyoxalase superfamily)